MLRTHAGVHELRRMALFAMPFSCQPSQCVSIKNVILSQEARFSFSMKNFDDFHFISFKMINNAIIFNDQFSEISVNDVFFVPARCDRYMGKICKISWFVTCIIKRIQFMKDQRFTREAGSVAKFKYTLITGSDHQT